jgi:nicotinate-nucleotide adenylyltransferase
MRIAIFGGTFDPVHLGHLILAEQCREQARLDQVRFVPAARPPHKLDRPSTPFGQRVEMLAQALAGHPVFRIDELENERPGPSYMADTLAEIQRRQPNAALHLILGADSLVDLPGWYDPQRIVELATLLIVPRPGSEVWPAEQLRQALQLPPEIRLRMEVVQSPLIEIASRDLRRRVAESRSIRYLVPRAVECYIGDKRLYRESV